METAINVFLRSGYWIRILLFFLVSACLCYGHGLFWKQILKMNWHPFELFGIGFVSILAVTECFGWPFIAYRFSSRWFTAVVGTAVLAPVLVSVAFYVKETRKGMQRAWMRRKKTTREKGTWVFVAPVMLLLIFFILSCVAAQKTSSDDSFYVSNIALFATSDIMNPYDSSMGDITTKTVPMYDFQIWEGLLSVPCRVFGFSATETAHTLVIAPLLFLSTSAFFNLGNALFRDDRKAWMFTGFILIVELGCRFMKTVSAGFLFRRIWQGKGVNINVVVPLLSAALIRAFFDKSCQGFLFPFLCNLAGVALNPTSLYVNGFQMLFLSLSLAIGTKHWKKMTQLIPSLAVILIFTVMIYLRTSAGKNASASVADEDFFVSAVQPFITGKEKMNILFLLAMVLLIIRGDARARLAFALPCAFMLVFLWNPWAGRFVAEKITKTPTYWRVFWLVPTGSVLAWAGVHICWAWKKKWQFILSTAAVCGLLAFGGAWNGEYEYTINVENTPQVYLNLGNYVAENQIQTPVLACQNVATVLRQDRTDLWLLVAKRQYVEDVYNYFGRDEEGNDRLRLYDFANRKLKKNQMDGIDELLQKYHVECVILAKSNKAGIQYLKDHGYRLERKEENFRVYRTGI